MNGLAKVIYNVYKNNIPTEYADMSGADRDEAIRKEIFKILGLESYSRKEFRQAWRQHKNESLQFNRRTFETKLWLMEKLYVMLSLTNL